MGLGYDFQTDTKGFTMIEWMMMGAFVAGLGLSVWKVYMFIPNKLLADDDTTRESVKLLHKIMLESHHPTLKEEELYEKMRLHPEFDPKHFWRFNPNRLRNLIESHRIKEPDFRR